MKKLSFVCLIILVAVAGGYWWGRSAAHPQKPPQTRNAEKLPPLPAKKSSTATSNTTNGKPSLAELEEKMRTAARKFDFKQAAAFRDRIKELRSKVVISIAPNLTMT